LSGRQQLPQKRQKPHGEDNVAERIKRGDSYIGGDMPKIQELIEAEQKLETKLEDLEPVMAAFRLLSAQAAELRDQIDASLLPFRLLVSEARAKQETTLTRWIESGSGYHRYVLRITSPTNTAWDSRAWLRRMEHGSNDRRYGSNDWHWTLNVYGLSSIRMDTVLPNVDNGKTPIADILAAADRILIDNDFTLTDLDNDPS
jgi:hypothetical protein